MNDWLLIGLLAWTAFCMTGSLVIRIAMHRREQQQMRDNQRNEVKQ